MNRGRLSKLGRIGLSVFTLACLVFFVCEVWSRADEVIVAAHEILVSRTLLIIEFLLMLIGICLEAFRWRTLSGWLRRRPFTEDVMTTLRAIAFGNSTPANIGEHVGRTMYTNQKKMSAILSIFSSFIQTCVIFFFGALATLTMYILQMPFPRKAYIFCLLVCCCALLFIFSSRHLRAYISRFIGLIPTSRILIAVLINSLRFFLFSLQLCLFLDFALPTHIFLPVLSYYFFLTCLPRLNIIDVGIKGSLALAILSPFASESKIEVATICIWFINIIIPTTAGLLASMFHVKH